MKERKTLADTNSSGTCSKRADGEDCSLRIEEKKVIRNSFPFFTRDLCQDRFILSVLNVTLFTYFH